MAVTGQMMLLFVIAHLLGNFTIFYGDINAYAAFLRRLTCLLPVIRVVMFTALCIHVYSGIVLTCENRASKPVSYAVNKHLKATFAGRNMIWSGIVIALFLIYHLMHFTFQITNPEFSALRHSDELGRPDVYMMVVHSFDMFGIVIAYLIGMTALLLHLFHGIQSSFQTLGINNDRSLPVVVKTGATAAIIFFLAYIAIPISIISGILKP